jgi:hypothetical protein
MSNWLKKEKRNEDMLESKYMYEARIRVKTKMNRLEKTRCP